jgi:hypothetical protein
MAMADAPRGFTNGNLFRHVSVMSYQRAKRLTLRPFPSCLIRDSVLENGS